MSCSAMHQLSRIQVGYCIALSVRLGLLKPFRFLIVLTHSLSASLSLLFLCIAILQSLALGSVDNGEASTSARWAGGVCYGVSMEVEQEREPRG